MKLLVVDIDGTVSDWRWRERFLDDKELFYDLSPRDFPHVDMVELVNNLSHFYRIVFCTGRRERHKDMTREWIEKHFNFSGNTIMVPDDYEGGDEGKIEEFKKYFKIEDIAFVLEDRNKIVKLWRDLGVRVLQVDNYEK
jgi:uncharacterized HAD superfamily protein